MLYKIINNNKIKEIGVFPQLKPIKAFDKKAIRTDFIGCSSDNLKLTISRKFYNFLKNYLPIHNNGNLKLSNDVYKFDNKKQQFIIRNDIKQIFFNYNTINIKKPKKDFIDFNNSIFFTDNKKLYLQQIIVGGISETYFTNTNHNFIKIDSEESYSKLLLKIKKNQEIIIPKKLVFNLSKNKEHIFRVFTSVNNLSGYYVSEKLMKEIKANNFTGIDFKPLDKLNPYTITEII